MFVKIKLESLNFNGNKTLPKETSYLELKDNDTILELKLNIENKIKVSAERLQIRSLKDILHDDETVFDIWMKEKKEGITLMLFTYKNEDDLTEPIQNDPNFICFLQLYSDEAAALQKQYEQKCINSATEANLDVVVLDSDIDEDDEVNGNSSVESTSDSTSGNSSVSDNSVVTTGKRTKSDLKGQTPKRMSLQSQFSSPISSFLHEFPNYNHNSEQSNQAFNHKYSNSEFSPPMQPKNSLINDYAKSPANSQPVKVETNIKRLSNAVYATPIETTEKSSIYNTRETNKPVITTEYEEQEDLPCKLISAEKRKYIVVIRGHTENMSELDCGDLLNMFFEKFKESDTSSRLQFDDKSSVTVYNGTIWIACGDAITFDWICDATNKFNRSIQAQSIKDFLLLSECSVVIPSVAKSKGLDEIFDLLQRQNMNLNTSQWVLQERRAVNGADDEFSDRVVSNFCANEVLFLLIDLSTRNLLQKQNYRLKYCFWKIEFYLQENL